MTKQKLVMIGNGMAGLRTIEEILERSDSIPTFRQIGRASESRERTLSKL